MTQPAIRVDGLSKRYHIGHRENCDTLGEKIMSVVAAPVRSLRNFGRSSHREADIIWALKDVSFEVQPGEVVGIIGRNGAGKSTLLKILTRITEPTAGRAELRGRVGSLLEVGTGFHPELTGRENIFLSGAILGMSRRETKSQLDEIIDFSGVEKFIDTPVKRYSSGMRVRLGFAVAAHLQPEILLIDEVLAVGDAEFQKKCLGKMGDVASQGRTILFVSHNMAAVTALCGRAVLLDSGQVRAAGRTSEIIRQYLDAVLERKSFSLDQCQGRRGNGELRFTGMRMLDSSGGELVSVACGSEVTVALDYASKAGAVIKDVDVGIAFANRHGADLIWCGSKVAGDRFRQVPARGTILCRFPKFPLPAGRYMLRVCASVMGETADWLLDVGPLVVVEGEFFGTGRTPAPDRCAVLVPHEWEVAASGEPS